MKDLKPRSKHLALTNAIINAKIGSWKCFPHCLKLLPANYMTAFTFFMPDSKDTFVLLKTANNESNMLSLRDCDISDNYTKRYTNLSSASRKW